MTEAPPNHSTLSRTRRLIDVETPWGFHGGRSGSLQGKTVGVDATTLENAAMRTIRGIPGIVRGFVRQLAKASAIETPRGGVGAV